MEDPQKYQGCCCPSLGPVCFPAVVPAPRATSATAYDRAGLALGQRLLYPPLCWPAGVTLGLQGTVQSGHTAPLCVAQTPASADPFPPAMSTSFCTRSCNYCAPVVFKAGSWTAAPASPGHSLAMQISGPVQTYCIGMSRGGPPVVLMHGQVWEPLLCPWSVPAVYV